MTRRGLFTALAALFVAPRAEAKQPEDINAILTDISTALDDARVKRMRARMRVRISGGGGGGDNGTCLLPKDAKIWWGIGGDSPERLYRSDSERRFYHIRLGYRPYEEPKDNRN